MYLCLYKDSLSYFETAPRKNTTRVSLSLLWISLSLSLCLSLSVSLSLSYGSLSLSSKPRMSEIPHVQVSTHIR